jgi:hypothetical protein
MRVEERCLIYLLRHPSIEGGICPTVHPATAEAESLRAVLETILPLFLCVLCDPRARSCSSAPCLICVHSCLPSRFRIGIRGSKVFSVPASLPSALVFLRDLLWPCAPSFWALCVLCG